MSFNKFKTIVLVCNLVLITTFTSLQSYAYSWDSCNGSKLDWDGSSINFKISTYSYPAGGSYNTVIRRAGQSWNNIPSNFTMSFTDEYRTSTTFGNNISEIAYGYPSGMDGAIGLTRHSTGTCGGFYTINYEIDEADIHMSSQTTDGWRTYTHSSAEDEALRVNGINFEATMLHELGHAVGLGHESRSNSVMAVGSSPYRTQGSVVLPFRDDMLGFQYLNGASGTKVDIGGRTYTFTSSNGSAGAEAVVTPLNSFSTNYSVGDTISVTHGIENLGTAPITTAFKVKWYLSTNDYISTYDKQLPVYATWGRLTARGTYTHSNTIPDVPAGHYYIGYLVDADNAVAEFTSSNNRIAIKKIYISK